MKSVYSAGRPPSDENIRLRGWHGDWTTEVRPEDQMIRHFDAPPPPSPIPPRSPESLAHGKPEGVFNPDDRQLVMDPSGYPYSAVCSLTIQNRKQERYYGTGFMAGPRLILTAGHNVYYHADGGFMEHIRVYPGLNGNRSSPQLPIAVSSRFATVEAWTRDANSEFDFGAIFLEQNLGQAVGTFSVSKFKAEDLQTMTLTLTGYPKDPPRNSGFPNDGSTQWRASGRVSVEFDRLTYLIDSSIGQSGSPLVAYFPENNEYHAVGIHNTVWTSVNAATRINDAIFSQIVRWRQQSDTELP